MRTLLFLAIIIFLHSCGSTPCAPGNLYFGLVGFSDAESQDIVLRRYTKGQNFSTKIDSIIVQYGFNRSNDTLEVTSLTGEAVLWSKYDYEIVFPLANRLYRIAAINEIQSEKKHSIFKNNKDGCINEITDLNINGQVRATTRFNRFYIVK
jgi:hypothetical protein